ncbi:MAG: M20/M25/M40 family metallo-hydrolase [Planctomycetota bacterium]
MGGRGTFAPWTKEVHNGADDNASGTTALLEVARRFASSSTPPRRRMVFIAFTGEESGLLGSRHYVRSPRFPLDDTIAMINMDMVGRLTDNELTIYGTGSAEEFDALVEGLNDDYEFDLEKVESGYGPSDHASFYGADVPVLFFFTGLHRDYHRPSDDWEKINVEGMRRIVGLAVDVIDAIDAADTRPTYAKTKRPRGMGIPNQAYLGIMPDMSGDAEGLRIQEVVADGPASAAGLEDGDVILMIGENEVTDFQSLGEALRKFKPEDKVPVKVQRSGAPVVLEVTLGSRG